MNREKVIAAPSRKGEPSYPPPLPCHWDESIKSVVQLVHDGVIESIRSTTVRDAR